MGISHSNSTVMSSAISPNWDFTHNPGAKIKLRKR